MKTKLQCKSSVCTACIRICPDIPVPYRVMRPRWPYMNIYADIYGHGGNEATTVAINTLCKYR